MSKDGMNTKDFLIGTFVGGIIGRLSFIFSAEVGERASR